MFYLLLSFVVLPANQEVTDPANQEIAGPVAGRVAEEGLWPSPKLQALLLRRFSEDLGSEYGFDEAQQAELDRAVLDRWRPYLAAHRERLKPLVNEYLELKMQLAPPPKEEIQSWARRALPEFELIKAQVYEGVDDLRDVANELQRVKVEAQALMLGGALTYGETQLTLWRDGEFDPTDFVAPRPAQRRARREKRNAKEQSVVSKPDAEPAKEAPRDFIEEELSLWDQYVVDFVRRFELDDGQRSSARSVLTEMKRRAMRHRSRKAQELATLEAQLASENQTPVEQAEIKRKIQALYGPVDELFAELKQRVEQLPTAAQRASVARREEAKKSAVQKKSTTPDEEKASPERPSPTPAEGPELDKDR